MKKLTISILLSLMTLVVVGGYSVWHFSVAIPASGSEINIKGLIAPVSVEIDQYGIPIIHADNKEDAYSVLGFFSAKDRLFQMDLMRRHITGHLAEVMGAAFKETDRWHRVIGFKPLAQRIYQTLPEDQQLVLQAYARGVNQAMSELNVLPPEFLLLGYQPARWTPEDSLLVILGMEEDLTWTADKERRNTIMEAALPVSVRAFFTPELDPYTDQLLHGQKTRPEATSLPVKELSALLNSNVETRVYTGLVGEEPPPKGSNGWVVASAKTKDGHAILANDMHLSLRVPNIWYRVELHYPNVKLIGLALPGVPLIVVGSNGHVAWGFTNIEGDFVDLVSLELAPDNPNKYRSSKGFVGFTEREEIVRVKDAEDYIFNVQSTEWGPVLPKSLLNKPVAVHWTALDPSATDLQLLNMDKVHDVHMAQRVLNLSGGPPLNALVADSKGNIAWTYTGKIPKRFGFDGSVSRSWVDGSLGWDGYISPDHLPRLINPVKGFIANANQRMVGEDYPYVIGHDFDQGYRAYRISEQLTMMENITEQDMLALQLDTKVDFYRYYQQLALSLLEKSTDKQFITLKQQLKNWDGHAERESSGFALLVEFRRLLLKTVISPFMLKCRSYDPTFRFSSAMADVSVQHLVNTKIPQLLPDKSHYSDWDSFLLGVLTRAQNNIKKHGAVEDLTWGKINRVKIRHPFSASLPLLQNWLDMPKKSLPGCVQCVRVSNPNYGASERMVVSPGNEKNALFQMPGGQSGHPLSPHYNDQQNGWVEGLSIPLRAGKSVVHLQFLPEKNRGAEL